MFNKNFINCYYTTTSIIYNYIHQPIVFISSKPFLYMSVLRSTDMKTNFLKEKG